MAVKDSVEAGESATMTATKATTATPELTNPFRVDDEDTIGDAPCTLVIFGASGDLSHRKLIPAVFALRQGGYVDAHNPVVGFARSKRTDEQFRNEMSEAIKKFSRFRSVTVEEIEAFTNDLYYQIGDYRDPETFVALGKRLEKLAEKHQTRGNCLFYLATPPSSFQPILKNLKLSGLVDESNGAFRRVVVEKPIGSNRETARELNEQIHDSFAEKQVFRIDHYLGKETVQNILAFRFGNGIFEPLWNRRYIDHVQITVAESIGVGSRAGYFDTAGITRDMLQSHILQLMTLIAMEPPIAIRGESIRDEKVKVLRAIKPFSRMEAVRNVVRAQYLAGVVDGVDSPGYRDENDISADSQTETFVALKLEIDNWRWSGVPFYIRTGKRLAKRVSQVNIVYRRPPLAFFEEFGCDAPEQNVLGIRIQPEEGISMSFVSKRPGPSFHIDPVHMDFKYSSSFAKQTPEAYERLILDAILGEASLFAREDEVDLSWKLIDPIIASWSGENPAPLYFYQAGNWGPEESSALLERSSRKWLRL